MKWWQWLLLIIAVLMILKDPAGSAHTVSHWWDSGVTFVQNL